MVGIWPDVLSTALVVLGFLLNILFLSKRGFPTIRHNEIRDLIANLLTEACHEVQVEPGLQPISDEQFLQASVNVEDGARLDISVNGFWGDRCEKTFWM